LFIVMEGTDGSGTTTQGDLLAEALRAQGHVVVRTAEPSQGPIGQMLRATLREQGPDAFDAQTVALLFAADRTDHVRRCIRPALARGETVVCDRYLGSSLAFQTVDGDGLIDRDWVLTLNKLALPPDLSVFLDVPPAAAMQRIVARGKPIERFEVEATLRQVHGRYRQAFERPPAGLGEAVVVDGLRQRAEVAADVWAAVTAVAARKVPA
jgi:dTMP kinase